MGETMTIRIANLLVGAIFLLLNMSAPPAWSAASLSSVARFAIPAGSLPGALHKFTEQSGIQVTSPSDLVDMKQTGGVSGDLPAAQALTQLLMGTQLEYDTIDQRTVSIHKSGHAAALAAGTDNYVRTASAAPPGGGLSSTEGAGVYSDASVAVLEEVVVTARRREERAQSVPASITAYSEKDLKAHNITDQGSLANNTPSLVAIASGQPAETGGFAIRGQGPAFGATPGTIGYFAEVPNGVLALDGRAGTYYDLASVQVLKGPQGTLFGKNATGGNVMFEPQRPTSEFGGYIQAQGGNFSDREFEGALNLPLFSDKALLRVSGAYARRNGYTHDVGPLFAGKDYDNLGYESFRVELLLRPIASLENYTIYRYYHSSDNGPGTSEIAFNPNAGTAPFLINTFFPNQLNLLAAQTGRSHRDVAYNIDEYDRSNFDQLINTTTFTINEAAKLKNIISYSKTEYSYGYDYDATVSPIAGQASPNGYTEAEVYYTEELQLQGRLFNDALQYVVGGFMDRQWPKEPSLGEFDYFPTTILLGGPLVAGQQTGTRSHAEFTQLTYDLGKTFPVLDGLSVTGGYRYTHDELSQSSYFVAPPFTGGNGKWNYGSYSFGVDYKIAPQVLTYVAVRSAYKAGGLNSQLPVDSPFATFRPEELKDVEVGLKGDFKFDGMAARINIDVYRGDYTNIQRTTNVVSQGVLVNVTNNAARGRISGLEWEGVFLPIPSIELATLYAYTDAKYTEVDSAEAALILDGAPFPYVSRNKGSLSARYRLPLPKTVGDVGVMGVFSYQSSQAIAQTNQTVFPFLPGYGVVNARLDWRDVYQSSVDVSAFVTNLTNRTYPIGQFDAYETFGFVTRTYGPPRMYGVQVRYAFGKSP
jgi:iron complex outermembrane recepter protein